jgi:outer membrane biosynthesis protein TonB
VKIQHQVRTFVPALALTAGMMIWGGALNAQTTTPSDPQAPAQTQPTPDTTPTQTPQAQSPQTPSPDAQTPSQAPDQTTPATPPAADAPSATDGSKSSAQTPAATDVQSFSGTVVKSGDKYVLQEDGGTTYDVDHQDDVKKFEGKRVKLHGTLDPTGKKILIQ